MQLRRFYNIANCRKKYIKLPKSPKEAFLLSISDFTMSQLDYKFIALKKEVLKLPNKNSPGEIRTLGLTGMSRALSPAELPCHLIVFIQFSKPCNLTKELTS